MVQLHNFFFLITSMVVPRGTTAPVLLKWFVSRDVPTGAPFSNGTIIPILIHSFPLLFYLHSRKFIRSTDRAKVESWSEQAVLFYYQTELGEAHPKLELEMPNFVSFSFFISFLSNPRGTSHIKNLSAVCSLYYSFVLSSFYNTIGQRSVSGRGEGKKKHFGLTGMSNDEMRR